MAHLQISDWELLTSGIVLVHESTSFYKSKRELQSSYHCSIYFSASAFCTAESDQASKADHPDTQCEGQEIEETQMFLPKMTSISF